MAVPEQFLSKDPTVRHQQPILLEEGLEGNTHCNPLWWSSDPFLLGEQLSLLRQVFMI